MEDLGIAKILQTMPHRYPFLLIDRVIEYTPFESIKALKNVSINEPFFLGHFPGHPIMPGVLILESMAQATGMLLFIRIRPAAKKAMSITWSGSTKRASSGR